MKVNRKEKREVRHLRLRQKIVGTAVRPRMAIFISNSHMYVQFIDDDAKTTLAATSTHGMGAKVNVETAKLVGAKAAEAAVAKGICMVVVDRGGFKFHGRVKAIVEAAVANGLKISEKPPKPPKEKPAKDAAPAKKDKGGDKGAVKKEAAPAKKEAAPAKKEAPKKEKA